MHIEDCIARCMRCYRTCLEMIASSLEAEGSPPPAAHLALLVDCAETCRSNAEMMLRHASDAERSCGCPEICRACALSCDEIAEEAARRCIEASCTAARSCPSLARLAA